MLPSGSNTWRYCQQAEHLCVCVGGSGDCCVTEWFQHMEEIGPFNQLEKNDCLFVGCLTSQQHACVSQGRICSDNFLCCHTEIDVADQTVHLTQSLYTGTGPVSPSADPITPCACQGSHWSTNFDITSMTQPGKKPGASGI